MQRNWKKLDNTIDFGIATGQTIASKSVSAAKAIKGIIPTKEGILDKLGLQLKSKTPSAKVANVNEAVDAEFTMLDEFVGKTKEEVEAIIDSKMV